MSAGRWDGRTIWEEGGVLRVLDQTRLPHARVSVELDSVEAAAHAIRSMQVRGAPLIGATAAWGMALAAREDPSDAGLERARRLLLETRPTAVNLRWALERCLADILAAPGERRAEMARSVARAICEEDVEANRRLGDHAMAIIRSRAGELAVTPDRPLRILTHCNAGRLATVGWGTATAGIYRAREEQVPLHVWVDETRPRRQGARLTAWELGEGGVAHTVVPDSAAAHLMATGRVDLVLVGTDRTTAAGDVANKIGTYGVALAAHDNQVPFYVAAPTSSIDFRIRSGDEVPIEERSGDEVAWVSGLTARGAEETVRLLPPDSPAANWAFDVTPARLVTGIITDRGVAEASASGLASLYPDVTDRA